MRWACHGPRRHAAMPPLSGKPTATGPQVRTRFVMSMPAFKVRVVDSQGVRELPDIKA
jgi:hypothetical protein